MFKFLSTFTVALALTLLPAAGIAGAEKSKTTSRTTSASKSAKPAKAQTRQIAAVKRDVSRLESLLAGVKSAGKVSDKSLKSVANEADTLANRIYANLQSAKAEKKAMKTAKELRSRVGEMKKHAAEGNHKASRRHAERALTMAYRLDEWAS